MAQSSKEERRPVRFFFVLDSSELTHTSFLVISEAIIVNRVLLVNKRRLFT
jgi:hypothetical protein